MKSQKQKQQLLIIGGVVAGAVLLLLAAIIISGNSNSVDIDYSALNPTRTSDGAFIIGNPDAPITIVEFADYACPHCQSYHPTIQRFINEYVVTGKARFEFRTFPTVGGQLTIFASQLAECTDNIQPGAFWDAYDGFFDIAKTGRYTNDGLRSVIQGLGVSYSEVLNCTESANQGTIDTNYGAQRGVTGTPAVMVRYGDGNAQWISVGAATYSSGSVPFEALAQVVQEAQPAS